MEETRNNSRISSPKLVSCYMKRMQILLRKEFPKVQVSFGDQGLVQVAAHPMQMF